MIKIEKPDISVKKLFHDCIYNLKRENEKLLISHSIEELENIYKKYDEYAIENDLHKFDMRIDTETENIVGKLYKNKLVNPKEKARLYYDKIINYQKSKKASSPIKFNDEFRICPMCHTSEVDNLDHYLPKAKYPVLSLNPINLIPICSKCNRNKIDYIPNSKYDNLIHLYFDDLENLNWLNIEITNIDTLSFTYYVDKLAFEDPILYKRTKRTFEVFGIGKTYEILATTEMEDQIVNLIHFAQCSSKNEFQEYLLSFIKNHTSKNIWKVALYKELSENDEFYVLLNNTKYF
ncbi:hypothetical protein ISO99_08185 [Staphylococcus sp. 18_1_E_LY]|uniref:HNH domain-containing protein n=1 Tax=Staphylococcus lloydii TaxID=2781774 RepID=A0A7T1FA12_9STAP|nr:hypothetical protein [Staphylococcus lloydii]MBF7019885.1 hypothetical protein [Staphylococcus lloydii]MBF7027568.1 hypothetical protein [Staphylococcus lloydii]QPM75256.1 hypothetical protein ISP08_00520 [Staphylococcus lloydii]